MQAMIFAAGLGTRLKPLTDSVPKAMIPLNGKPLLEYIVNHLIKVGFRHLVINVHHFAPLVKDFLQSKRWGAEIIISDEAEKLLDTGGGLLKARNLFHPQKPILIQNVDILCNLDLRDLYQFHQGIGALATLAVKNRTTSRMIFFDQTDCLCSWKNVQTGEEKHSRKPVGTAVGIAFSGIHIINQDFFNFVIEQGCFSIMDVYLRLAATHKITQYRDDYSDWIDVGRLSNINDAESFLLKMNDFY